MLKDFIDTMRNYKRSSTSGVWLQTYEINRTIDALQSLSVEEGMNLYVFNAWQGLVNVSPAGYFPVTVTTMGRDVVRLRELREAQEYVDPDTQEPITSTPSKDDRYASARAFGCGIEEALRAAVNIKATKDTPVLVALCDLSDVLQGQEASAIMSSIQLRVNEYHNFKSIIAVVSDNDSIPTPLKRVLRLVKMPLPSKEENIASVNAIVNGIGQASLEKLGIARSELVTPSVDEVSEALAGLTQEETNNIVSLCVARDKKIEAKVVAKEKSNILAHDGLLEFAPCSATMKDYGGYENLREYIIKRKDLFTEDAASFGIRRPKGILLVGPPGCGKSLICKIVADVFKKPFCDLRIDKLFGGIVGDTEKNTNRALDQLCAMAPIVARIDEIDKVLPGDMNGGAHINETTNRMTGRILSFMNDQSNGVYIIGTCNSIENMNEALTRKGRFDEIFYVGLPNESERKDIIGIHIAKRGRDITKFDLDKLSKATNGMSGAEIEELVNSSLIEAFNLGKDLDTKIIIEVSKTFGKLSDTCKEKIQKLMQWAKVHKVKNASNSDSIDKVELPEGRNIELDYSTLM